MSLKLPAIPYPPAGEGYWGKTTSTIDWCEENYYATIYSAEIVNTLTNLLFVLLALLGLTNCWKNGHDRIFMTTYGGYMAVGLGSFCFHSSLKYPWQLVDELSMIYTACFTCYASFSYMKSTKQRAFIGGTLISLATFITLYYHFLQDPVFHQFSFAILTTVVLTRSMYIMEKNLRPKWRGERQTFYHGKEDVVSAEEQKRRDARDKAILVQMWWMIAYGLGIFLTGFGLWGLDRVYCNNWRTWRRELGLPWGIFLELHGWWHIMTGIGSYFYIMWGAWLRHCLNGRQDEYQLWWPHMVFTVPLVVRRKDYNPKESASTGTEKANGSAHYANGSAHYANGSANKMNGSMNGYVNGSANGHMNGHANGSANGYMNGSAKKRRA